MSGKDVQLKVGEKNPFCSLDKGLQVYVQTSSLITMCIFSPHLWKFKCFQGVFCIREFLVPRLFSPKQALELC